MITQPTNLVTHIRYRTAHPPPRAAADAGKGTKRNLNLTSAVVRKSHDDQLRSTVRQKAWCRWSPSRLSLLRRCDHACQGLMPARTWLPP